MKNKGASTWLFWRTDKAKLVLLNCNVLVLRKTEISSFFTVELCHAWPVVLKFELSIQICVPVLNFALEILNSCGCFRHTSCRYWSHVTDWLCNFLGLLQKRAYSSWVKIIAKTLISEITIDTTLQVKLFGFLGDKKSVTGDQTKGQIFHSSMFDAKSNKQ